MCPFFLSNPHFQKHFCCKSTMLHHAKLMWPKLATSVSQGQGISLRIALADLGSKREVQGLSGPVLETMQNGPNELLSVLVTQKSKPKWSSPTFCTEHGVSTCLAKTMKFNIRKRSKRQKTSMSGCKYMQYASFSISTIHG